MASQMEVRAVRPTTPLTESNGGWGVESWNLWRAYCMGDVPEVGAGQTAGAGKGAEVIGGVGRNEVSGCALMSTVFRQT